MKLIDLLVRELPKRGGWPEGADWCVFHDIDEEVSFGYRLSPLLIDGTWTTLENDSNWLCRGDFYHQNSNDFDSAIVTRDQYESALAASQKVEWSGDGLPPIGCECEYIPGMLSPAASSDDNKPIEPTIIKIVAHEQYPNGGNDVVVGIWMAKSGGMRSSVFSPRCLVNARSEDDKKRDAVINALTEFTLRGDACDIYDAIAAGKIPGVKLED